MNQHKDFTQVTIKIFKNFQIIQLLLLMKTERFPDKRFKYIFFILKIKNIFIYFFCLYKVLSL